MKRTFVFGDLRPMNILYSPDDDRATLVDFDGVGKHGEDRHSPCLNVLLGLGVNRWQVMEKSHDSANFERVMKSSHTYRTPFPVRFLCLSLPRPLVPAVIPRRWLFSGPASFTYPRPRSRWRSCPRLEVILLLAAGGGCQRGLGGGEGGGGVGLATF